MHTSTLAPVALRFRLAAIAAAAIWLGSSAPIFAGDADNSGGSDELAEVVVTGSYIRRTTFQQSSPVDVVNAERLETRAPADLARFFTDLPYNIGSAFSNGTAQGANSGGGNINLRGLGAAATLVLINTKRQTQYPAAATSIVDVNETVPQIMIGRIDILKDGASALYGTDAVAGVVNFITKDDYTGAEFRVKAERLAQTKGKGDLRFEAIFGGGSDQNHLVAAFEYDKVDLVRYTEFTAGKVSNLTTLGSPGNYGVPTRTAAGVLTTTVRSTPDPNCGRVTQSLLVGTTCNYNFWPDQSGVAGMQRFQSFMRMKHAFSDTLHFNGELGLSSSRYESSNTAAANLTTTVTVPGDNPGNTFRAVNSLGQPLFAVPNPANSRLPLRDSTGRVVLTATPTVASSGIAFNEDVTFNGRPIGSQGGLPTNNAIAPGDFAVSRRSHVSNDTFRLGGELAGKFGAWDWNSSLNYSRYSQDTEGPRNNTVISALRLAVAGLGGANCNPVSGVPGQGQCSYFNPFGNSTFAAAGAAAANSQSTIDFIMPALHDRFISSLGEFDLVATGKVIDLPAGELGAAFGYQRRLATLMADYDTQKNLANTEQGVPQTDFSANRSISAVFAEMNAPLVKGSSFGSLELNAAVRRESAGGNLTSTDPKAGLIYRTPGGKIGIRGSWGKSFLAPSLFQQNASTTSLQNVNDPVTGQLNVRVTAVQTGNPNLSPQTAKSYSFGFDVRPLNNLQASATYWKFDFANLIASENTQTILNADPNGSRVVRDPVTNQLLRIQTSFFNAANVQTSGIDFEGDWRLEAGRAGDFSFNVAATKVLQYDLQTNATSAVLDRRNNLNATTFGSPSIDWRGTARITWHKANQVATVGWKYTGGFTSDRVVTPTTNPIVGSFATVDAVYNYTISQKKLGWSKVNSIVLSLGADNAFDKLANNTAFTVFYGNIHDYRGRILWARMDAKF